MDFVTKDNELPHSNVSTFETPITSDHKAIAMITNVTVRKHPPKSKIIIDNSTYCKNFYLQDLTQIDWDVFYTAFDAENVYRVFKKILSVVIRDHAYLKTIFIRNEKCTIKLESNDSMKSISKKADSEKRKWIIINDSRNSTTKFHLPQKLF